MGRMIVYAEKLADGTERIIDAVPEGVPHDAPDEYLKLVKRHANVCRLVDEERIPPADGDGPRILGPEPGLGEAVSHPEPAENRKVEPVGVPVAGPLPGGRSRRRVKSDA